MYKYIFLLCSFVGILSSTQNYTSDPQTSHKKLIGSDHNYSKGPFFVIITASFKNANYCIDYIQSVAHQQGSDYCILYTEDNSPDKTKTHDLIFDYLKKNNCLDRLIYIQNSQRKGSLHNIYDMIHLCDPRAIAVMVDGDDYLYDNNVLSYLARIYKNPDIWLTYGQYVRIPGYHLGGCTEIPQEIIQGNLFRNYDFVASHLKSFYCGLFQKINRDDLLFSDNTFFSMAGDLAFMLPMLEMAGSHSKYISKILYIYNNGTPLNDSKVNIDLQIFFSNFIYKKKRYTPIDSPF